MGVGGTGGSPHRGTAAEAPSPSVHDDGSLGSSGMEQVKAVVKMEVTLVCARGLKNTRKLLGRMSPCAVMTVPGTQLRGTSNPDEQGGTNPRWNQTITFPMPEALLRTTDPKPTVHVELFDGPACQKSLGAAVLPLAPAIAHYEEDPLTATAWVMRKGRPRGELTCTLRCCGRPSFAPLKCNTEEYKQFVASLLPPPMPPPRPAGPSQPARDPGKGLHAAHPHPPSQFEEYRARGPPMLYPTYGEDSRDSRGHVISQPTTVSAPAPAMGYPASPYQTPVYPVQPHYPSYSPYPYVQPAPVFMGHARGGGYGGYGHRHGRRGGGMGGFGTGMLAGALGGLLLGDALDGDIGDIGF